MDDVKAPQPTNPAQPGGTPSPEPEAPNEMDPTDPGGQEPETPKEEQPPEQPKSSGGNKMAMWIMFVVIALLIGSIGGYVFGNSNDPAPVDTSQTQALEQQITDLQTQLDKATKAGADALNQQAQKEISDLKDQVSKLEADNTAKDKEIATLEQEIKDLEKQLKDADSGN